MGLKLCSSRPGTDAVRMWSGCAVRVLGTGALPVERKARELLTILTVHAPAAVGLDELARLLWDDPPPSAVKTLRAHLSRIRTALRAADRPADPVARNADGSADSVAGGAGGLANPVADIERVGRDGYRLAIAAERTDVGLVAAARVRARRLLADGEPD